MSDAGMMGDSGFEKRLRDNIQRLDEKIEAAIELQDEKNDHLKSIVKGNDQRYAERFAAQESAAKYVQEKTNEFRKALQDVGERQMPRTEAESEFKSIKEQHAAGVKSNADKIEELRARMDRNEGRGTVADPMVEQLFRKVESLSTSRSEGSGEKSGRLSQQQLLLWLVTIATMLVAIFIAFRGGK